GSRFGGEEEKLDRLESGFQKRMRDRLSKVEKKIRFDAENKPKSSGFEREE
ncbi:unnamed protein product, partial [Dovyalis caffra]